jgi:hypothetical protein
MPVWGRLGGLLAAGMSHCSQLRKATGRRLRQERRELVGVAEDGITLSSGDPTPQHDFCGDLAPRDLSDRSRRLLEDPPQIA